MLPLLKLVGEELIKYIKLELKINTKAIFSARGLSEKFMIQSIGICSCGENAIYVRDAGFLERFNLMLHEVTLVIELPPVHNYMMYF